LGALSTDLRPSTALFAREDTIEALSSKVAHASGTLFNALRPEQGWHCTVQVTRRTSVFIILTSVAL